MKKYILKCKPILISIILFIFFLNINIVINSTKEACYIFFNYIFISIFPFILLSDILIYYDYHIFLKNLFGKFLYKFLYIDSSSTIVLFLSLLTCQPSNSIFLKSMLDNKNISLDSARKTLIYTYFPSISFVIGSIGINIYKNKLIGLILYLCMLISNLMICIYFKKEKSLNISYFYNNKNSFFDMLYKSIYKAINTSFTILTTLIIFFIILNIINNLFNINQILFSIIAGILELSSGIINISELNISFEFKMFLTSFILNFGGLCVIFQSINILNDYNFNIKKILIIKLIFSLLSSILFVPIWYLFKYWS